MARIKTYNIDTDISSEDKVVGTDGNPGNNFGKTKNFTVGALSGFIGAGSQGPQGPAGETGATGPAGSDGADGSDGTDGAQGPAGNDGADGATGPTGQTGAQGATGQTGSQGASGADGTSISVLGTVANCSGLPTSGNTSGDLYVLDSDDAGCSYGAGTAGDGYVWTSGNTWLNIGPLRGPQGIQGVEGAQGDQGAAGVNGSNGEQGIQGIQGIQGQAGQNGSNGAQGETGAIGPTGPTGPQGPIGLTGPPGAVESVNAGTGISVTPNTTGNVTVSLTSDVVTQTTGTVEPSIEAGITGASYTSRIGHWARTGNMVDVYLRVSTSSFSYSDLGQALKIKDCIPYAVEGRYNTGADTYFFMGNISNFQNISNNGTEFPSLFLSQIKTNASGTNASISITRPSGYSTASIITSNLASGGLVIALSFRYRCQNTETLLPGATKN